MDAEDASTALHVAIDQAQKLQSALRRRQEDLLCMEADVCLIASGPTLGRVVIDQAEDIRRAVRSHACDHLPAIAVAARAVDLTLDAARCERAVPVEVAIQFERQIRAVIRESRRAGGALAEVVEALRPTSQALPAGPELGSTAQASIDTAVRRLENARRATFRIVEDLPLIERALGEISPQDAHPTCVGCRRNSMSVLVSGSVNQGRDTFRAQPYA